MKHSIKQITIFSSALLGSLSLAVVPAAALASTGNGGANASATSTANTTKLKLIISRGDTEIARRLTTLNTVTTKLNSAVKLSADDKATLTTEVNNEISGLNNLKTQLDGETDVAAAKTDAQSIFNDYRVYALVVPKVWLVKTADDQLVTEGKLTTLAGKLQADITADQQAGKNVAALQTKLDDINSKVQAAQAISTDIQSKVINLQPSDYNTDHSVLSGDRDQLKTAQSDLATAITDGKAIVSGLKSL